jgi:uncharacterized protein with PIN domain
MKEKLNSTKCSVCGKEIPRVMRVPGEVSAEVPKMVIDGDKVKWVCSDCWNKMKQK